mmetsp:Transcript_17626/g.32091  ORF Transcript_17626/g.32091 Transcript_17626/m.32091 type:complete len:323 (+) Transcript_17626:953-1921(+)
MFYGRPGLLLATRIQHDARLHNHCFQDRWLSMLQLGESIWEVILVLFQFGAAVEACLPPRIGVPRLLLRLWGCSCLPQVHCLIKAIPRAWILLDAERKYLLNFWQPFLLDFLHPYDVPFGVKGVLLFRHLFMKGLDAALLLLLLLLRQSSFVLLVSPTSFFLLLRISQLLLLFIHNSSSLILYAKRSGLRLVTTGLPSATSPCIGDPGPQSLVPSHVVAPGPLPICISRLPLTRPAHSQVHASPIIDISRCRFLLQHPVLFVVLLPWVVRYETHLCLGGQCIYGSVGSIRIGLALEILLPQQVSTLCKNAIDVCCNLLLRQA